MAGKSTTVEKRKVKFTVDHTVKDARRGTKDEEAYKVNRTYSLPIDSALHFVRLNVAEFVE